MVDRLFQVQVLDDAARAQVEVGVDDLGQLLVRMRERGSDGIFFLIFSSPRIHVAGSAKRKAGSKQAVTLSAAKS